MAHGLQFGFSYPLGVAIRRAFFISAEESKWPNTHHNVIKSQNNGSHQGDITIGYDYQNIVEEDTIQKERNADDSDTHRENIEAQHIGK